MSKPITPSQLRTIHALFVDKPRTTTWAPIMASDCAMLADAMDIADTSARSLIESECLAAGPGPGSSRWWDTSTADPESVGAMGQALRYLAARGLLVRREGAGHIVRFHTSEN